MLSAKFVLIFLAVVAYTQGTPNTCPPNQIDLCAVIRSLETLDIEVPILDLILKLQNLLNSLLSNIVCSLGLKVCLPICNVVNALLDLHVNATVIDNITATIVGQPPNCPKRF